MSVSEGRWPATTHGGARCNGIAGQRKQEGPASHCCCRCVGAGIAASCVAAQAPHSEQLLASCVDAYTWCTPGSRAAVGKQRAPVQGRCMSGTHDAGVGAAVVCSQPRAAGSAQHRGAGRIAGSGRSTTPPLPPIRLTAAESHACCTGQRGHSEQHAFTIPSEQAHQSLLHGSCGTGLW